MRNKLRRIIIAAVAKNGVIGNGNEIPWYSKEELSHFKNTTIGYPIIFGRKTFQSIGKPLSERVNLVISGKPQYKSTDNNLFQFHSVKDAYVFLRKNNYEQVFIGGGERIYRNVIKHAEEMLISHMKFSVDGDRIFPKINSKIWEVENMKEFKEFTVTYYIRKMLSD